MWWGSKDKNEVQVVPGVLSNEDIVKLLNKEIVICGYDKNNLTGVGYNLTSTEFIFSINKGLLNKIYNDGKEKYCYIEPNDTVLILTREAIWVSEGICGTFHSKVKLVSQGFGHISTTLDALWEGPLLISLNNPTKKRLKFVIGYEENDKFKYQSFVTLIFYRMITPTSYKHDNLACRFDILKKLTQDGMKRFWYLNEDYKQLQNVIEYIREFESLQVNIGRKVNNETRTEKIKRFRDKYDYFVMGLNSHIIKAHEINSKIIRVLKFKKYGGITIGALLILALLYWSNEVDSENIITIFATVVTPVIVLFIDRTMRKDG